ncbi:MAG TPA: ScyD/ScyE family protein [Kineosporiaceae bacterium]|nr:ScyD/ScyE family protein [Kineosporiaceae bacterium]
MCLRTGRALAVTALVAASATVAAVASSADAAPVQGSAAPAAAPAGRSATWGHHVDLRSLTAGRTAQLRAAAAEGPPPPPAVPAAPYPFKVTKLSTDVLAPFHIGVDPKKQPYVAEGFFGALLKFNGKVPAPVFVVPKALQGGEVTGIDFAKDGSWAATYGRTTDDGASSAAFLRIQPARGKAVTVDLGGYERKNNPDKVNHYGAQTNDPCALAAFDFTSQGGPPAKYTGLVDTHAYSVAAVPGGWVAADAAGNDLIVVDTKGRIKAAYVLPPVGVKITPAIAAAQHLPDCTIGVTYNFEPVPTDAEYAAGKLYVSTLSGGYEGLGLPTGAAWTVGLDGKHLTLLASGFLGATGLTVTPSGTVLVAELGASRIDRIAKGKIVPLFALPNALSVQYANGSIYAGGLADLDFSGPRPVIKHTGSFVRYDYKP